MSKPVLGRGLGELMNKAADPKPIPTGQPQTSRVENPGPGVGSLLKGNRVQPFAAEPDEKAAPAPTNLPKKQKSAVPVWYLFAADIVLVLFGCLLVFKNPELLGWKRIAFACAATVLGGILATMAILMTQDE